jgi:hypothetical protein
MTIKIRLNHRGTHGASEWARENCPSYIVSKFTDYNPPSYYELTIDHYFEDTVQGHKDATLFTLRWA